MQSTLLNAEFRKDVFCGIKIAENALLLSYVELMSLE